MKKILVTSDSHGKIETLYKIYKKNIDADLFIHLGDYVSDAQKIQERLGISIECVKANGDFGCRLALTKQISVGGKKILIVHGHIQRVKLSLRKLNLFAIETEADVALFGHTHIQKIEQRGALLVNPGCAYHGQYAILLIDKAQVNAKGYRL